MSKRPVVELPELKPTGILAPESAAQEQIEAWEQEVRERVASAILTLAEENDADPMELAKVGYLLVDLAPHKQYDKRRKGDWLAVMVTVAAEQAEGKSQAQACISARTDPKTFRKYRNEHSKEWAMFTDFMKLVKDNGTCPGRYVKRLLEGFKK